MKKIFLVLLLSINSVIFSSSLSAQNETDTTFYLITCGPGTETYSVYGHSALRLTINSSKTDIVYNWGVFDFNTPNFAWKFAKGRLDYFLDTSSLDRFLPIYFYEQRYVISQKINLSALEKRRLTELINENMKPENITYRYDFFFNDCSTIIRDLLEEAIGKSLLYPPVELKDPPTFRQMVGKYQNPFPWYKFGVDLIMGSPGDKEALFRDRMFLPVDMKEGLSESVIHRDGKMIPLLQNPVTVLDFDPPVIRTSLFLSPVFLFTVLMIIVIIISGLTKSLKNNRRFDIIIYSVYSLLAILMIFFNFFTDHAQMRLNLNILWLNPFIIICLAFLILNKPVRIWYRIVFIITAIFLVLHFFLPQEFNLAFLPLAVIILVRSSVRAGFDWNPLSLEHL